MDLTLSLQQEQIQQTLPYSIFSMLVKIGLITLVCKPLFSYTHYVRRRIVIHELFVVNLPCIFCIQLQIRFSQDRCEGGSVPEQYFSFPVLLLLFTNLLHMFR